MFLIKTFMAFYKDHFVFLKTPLSFLKACCDIRNGNNKEILSRTYWNSALLYARSRRMVQVHDGRLRNGN